MKLAIDSACNKMAPLWPLKSFVAVNPFLGFSDKSFHEVCASFRRINRADVLMPLGFYEEAVRTGEIKDKDLEAVLIATPESWPVPRSTVLLKEQMMNTITDRKPTHAVVATISEVLDRLARGNRHSSRTAFMIDEISKFCASYFDEGQAIVPFPLKDKPLYQAWLESQRFDRNPEFMGLKHFRATLARLPKDPIEAITYVLRELGIPPRATEDYLYRALFDIKGWASYVRHLVWKSELRGETNSSLVELLAIRVVWGYGLFLERTDQAFTQAWKAAMDEAARLPRDHDLKHDADLALRLVLHEAYELAHQRSFICLLSSGAAPGPSLGAPSVQAVFCIDVRSEIFRRAFEAAWPGAETFGFAGFFGVPFEFIGLGDGEVSERGPVLLNTAYRVLEGPEDELERAELISSTQLQTQMQRAWKRFKQSAISCFAYVEAVGIFSLFSLIGRSLGIRQKPKSTELAPLITEVQKIQVAKSILKGMSLTKNFSKLVLLVGHGSESVNNPHASGLDCGACGGHSGEANARVVARILNEPGVRKQLMADGVAIPADTWFLGALHNTTTDEISLFDLENIPAEAHSEVQELKSRLAVASQLARAERAPLLDSDPLRRSSDWSQVRPEWGLAGNSAFVVGPRHLSSHTRLRGQAFLHTYDWKADQDFAVLELIMTAPMIVASWINLQYFASTTNNGVFGAGNKVLHNVTGTLGVMEGGGGDLKVGLPWQSVHDGQNFIHKPLRLNVVIAAPVQAITDVIRKHAGVRNLVDNGWIHLFAQADDGRVTHKYGGNLTWTETGITNCFSKP